MDPRQTMLFFRGGRQNEELLVNGRYERLPVAHAICELLEMNDALIQDMESLQEGVAELSKEYWATTRPVILDENEEARASRYVLNMKNRVNGFLAGRDEMISRLLVMFPAFEAYAQSNDVSERVLPSKRHINEIMALIASGSSMGDPKTEEYLRASRAAGEEAGDAAAWGSWLAVLTGAADTCMWTLVADVLLHPETGYGHRLHLCIEELQKLKKELGYVFLHDDHDAEAELKHHLIGPRRVNGENLFPEPSTKADKYCVVYGFISLTELVTAELNLLEEIDRPLRRCALCGRFFVPYQKNSMYCKRQNPEYNNKPCSRVGSMAKYQETHKQLDTPLGKEYRKNYKRYRKWAKDNRSFVNANIQLIGDAKEERKHRVDISNEIEENLETWDCRAKTTLEKWYRGETGTEECDLAVKCPPIPERSPRMAAFREYVRAARGN